MKQKKKGNPFSDDALAHLIQIYGSKKIVFEACRRILEYSEETILIEGKERVRISGENLRLIELGGGNLAAVGKLKRIDFEGARARRG